ncbi:MAG: hypothetical protein P9M06_04755 [Candidatus Saelkia tenebricola]|nr:hypothetical protein [Candidatus Saelkia tenebricola]
MNIRKVFYLLLVALFFQGCAAFQSIHYGEEYSPPTHVENIQLFSYNPEKGYVELGQVTVFGVTHSNRIHMLGRLKEMAAEMGGDAVVLQERKTPLYTPKPIVGTVIKWQQEQL